MQLILISLLLIVIVALAYRVWQLMRQRKALENVQKSITDEDGRLFSFLHSLGELLHKNLAPRKLHQHVAKGVTEALATDGAALYVFDAQTQKLVPSHVTSNCPPLIELPPQADFSTREGRMAIRSQVRLQTVAADVGLLGEAFQKQALVLTEDLVNHPSFATSRRIPGPKLQVMVAPLTFGGRRVGVLAVARRAGVAFTAHEVAVFQSVAEQSAFALGSAEDHRNAVEKRRLEDEIKKASEIQKVLLPSKPPQLQGWTLAATYRAATVVSGDYYDFIPLESGKIGLVVADVSGKGIAAGLVMATCRSLLRASANRSESPSEVLGYVNKLLFGDIKEDMFVSLAYAVIDPLSGEVLLSRAGHDAPFLSRKDGLIECLRPAGLALGVDKGPVFSRVTKDASYHLSFGDALVLYTDGLTEAINPEGEEYGGDRLRGVLELAVDQRTASDIMSRIVDNVGAFMGTKGLQDDMTMVIIRRDADPVIQ